jgi:hypothetical protein
MICNNPKQRFCQRKGTLKVLSACLSIAGSGDYSWFCYLVSASVSQSDLRRRLNSFIGFFADPFDLQCVRVPATLNQIILSVGDLEVVSQERP